MKHDLPSPDQMLEELADKAAAQLNKLAPVAFDAALNELTRYHRFLLSVYASETPDGAPFNYAEVGGFFGSPHEKWISQYRRLFEAAADRLADDPDFVVKLAHIPIRLLPREGDAKLSPGVLRRIVDLGPGLVHRLEAWVTKRTTIDNAPNASASPRLILAGSDRKAYEGVVTEVVGAWESLLQLSPSLYGWREERRGSELERWAAFAASWPFLWRHLRNTAYLLAVAVWNEDETGTVLYRDALVRWPASFSHRIAYRAELLQRRLLFPDVLANDWDRAAARVKPLLPEYMPPPGPDPLFSATVRGAHDDVILLTAALMLFWFMTEKQVSDVGARTAAALLRREPAHAEDRDDAPVGPRSFRSLFLDMLRLELAGERFRDESYGGQLDEVVSSLDAMSERRVVPGRVYAPSTLHDREGLISPMLAILLAAAPADGDDGLRQRIDGLARDEVALPEGDRSLRNILHYLRTLSTALKTPQPELRRAVLGLKPDKDFEASVTALRTIIDDGITVIEAQRLERLKQRPVDPAKLERMRVAVEGALLTAPADISFFRDFELSGRPHADGTDLRDYTVSINGIGKGELVDPPMEPESSNLIEIVAKMACQGAANRVWGLFTRRPRESMTVAGRIEEEAFWRTIAQTVRRVGPEPVLLVSRQASSRLHHRFLYPAQADKPNLKIERKPREDTGGFYIATVEGVDIYSADFDPGTAWLFSARALHAVTYAALDAKNHRVDLTFEPGQEMKGALRIRFIQSAVWADYPIFDIRLDDTEDNAR
jgi:hypothetical protein